MKEIQNNILTLNFVKEKKNHKHFQKTLIYKAKQFMLTKNLKKSKHILEDSASGVQVVILDK